MSSEAPLDAESWRRVNDIFHRAVELEGSARAACVASECADSLSVRDEVLSLLAAHDRADQFLAKPDDVAAALLRVGQQIGHYRIDSILGHGGMGVVYQAFDLKLIRTVALKAISPAVAQNPNSRERLRREGLATSRFTHPGIATVYALEEIGDELFLAAEFIQGETLRREVGRGPVNDARVLTTGLELARALAAAHDHGIVHRDLKPENVIRSASGELKILDFGLARVPDLPPELTHLTDDGRLFGTPAYMSPEQIRQGELDGRSDLFSLGIILYEMATGRHPFDTGIASVTIGRILETDAPAFGPATSTGNSGALKRGLEAITRTLLQKAPEARFASAHELVRALERLRGSGEVPVTAPATSSHQAWRWWRLHQAIASAFYALMLIPLWLLHLEVGGRTGSVLFLVPALAIVAAITLRMHLWFAAESLPGEWARQRRQAWPWLRTADVVVAAGLAAMGIAVIDLTRGETIMMLAAGVLVLLSSTIIEPATTRAAFPQGVRGTKSPE